MATQEELDARAADLDAREKALAEQETARQQDQEADAAAQAAVPDPPPTNPDDILTPEERSVSDRERAARPHVDKSPETPEEVQALADAFAEYRKEVAELRKELAAHRPRVQQVAAQTETPEQRRDAHLALVADHSHYCPGCGRLSKYPRECRGPDDRPHPPLEMVSTDELGGDPANHTAAPPTEELAA